MNSVRARASSKAGSRNSSRPAPAPLNAGYCDTHSTPAETKTWPSPALMAWKAIREVCTDDAQNRLTVVPGSVS